MAATSTVQLLTNLIEATQKAVKSAKLSPEGEAAANIFGHIGSTLYDMRSIAQALETDDEVDENEGIRRAINELSGITAALTIEGVLVATGTTAIFGIGLFGAATPLVIGLGVGLVATPILNLLADEAGITVVPARIDYSDSTQDLVIHATTASDTITTSKGNNLVFAGAGSDEIFQVGGSDEIDGGGFWGTDTLDYSRLDGQINVTISNDKIRVDHSDGTDIVQRIEIIKGTNGSDTFIVSREMSGTVSEFHGADGDDYFVLDDTYLSIDLFGGEGTDTLQNNGNHNQIDITLTEDSQIENYIGNDKIDIVTGNSLDNEILGEGGRDQLKGGAGRDTIYGGDEIDIIEGGDDGDFLYGDKGEDRVRGQGGDDFIYGGDDNDILSGGEGSDFLFGNDGRDRISGGSGNDHLFGGDSGSGDDGSVDTLDGGEGYDTYYAGDGDIIKGSSSGRVYFNGITLTGGEKESDEKGCSSGNGGNHSAANGEYEGSNGEKYFESGGGLRVEYNGASLKIESWSNGDLGIKLDEEGPKDGSSCSRDDVPDHYGSPLVLDLDGDGIELVDLKDSVAFFDIDNDGLKERLSWIASDDGILALDSNGDGEINDANELFGYGETYSARGIGLTSDLTGPSRLDIRYTSGFEKLGTFDQNEDGVINDQDAVFSELRVWRDLNGNGISTNDELFSLSDVGVSSISLEAATVRENIGDSFITDKGQFETTNGDNLEISDLWFRFNQYDTKFDIPNDLDPTLDDLPDLNGAGKVKDLKLAMAEDLKLRALVEEFTSLEVSDLSRVSSLVNDIIYRWTGNTVGIISSENADSRQVEVIGDFSDTVFRQTNGTFVAREQAGAILTEIYNIIHRDVSVQLFAQSNIGQSLFPEISYKSKAFLLLAEGSNSAEFLDRLVNNLPDDSSLHQKIAYFHAGLRILDAVYESFEDIELLGDQGATTYRGNVETLLQEQGIELTYVELISAHVGGDGDDFLIGQAFRGNHYAQHKNVIVSGAGDDDIRFAGPDNIFYWGKGQGNDDVTLRPYIYGEDFVTEIRLNGLSAQDITITASSGFDILITIIDSGEVLSLNNLAQLTTLSELRLVLDDLVLNEKQLRESINIATNGDDVLVQTSETSLDGLEGNDVLIGMHALGTPLPTNYFFNIGSGQDEIRDNLEGENVVTFGTDITAGNLVFSRSGFKGETLVISIDGTEDSLRIQDQYKNSEPIISRFIFNDGTELSAVEILDLEIEDTDGDGVSHGSAGNNDFSIYDISFDDADTVFHGYNGADTYYFYGAGTDTIEDLGNDDANDLVKFDFEVRSLTAEKLGINFSFLDEDFGDQIIINNEKGRIELYEFIGNSGSDIYTFEDLINNFDFIFSNNEIVGTSNGEELIGTDEHDRIRGLSGNDVLRGGVGFDKLFAGFGDDQLYGDSGDDVLEGSYGSDTYHGGLGNDIAIERDGNSIFYYNLGDGNDIYIGDSSSSGLDVLQFGAGINSSDLSYSFVRVDATQFLDEYQYEKDHLALKIDLAQGGSITLLDGRFNSLGYVDEVRFDDGTSLSKSEIFNLANVPTDGDDQLFAERQGDDDTFDAGLGNDIIDGNGGQDIVKYDLGDGNDTILGPNNSSSSASLIIQLGGEISEADITFEITGETSQDLKILFPDGGSILIQNNFIINQTIPFIDPYDSPPPSVASTGFEQAEYLTQIELTNGVILNSEEIKARALAASSGNDVQMGSALDDTILTSAGDDILKGGFGSDQYEFGLGAGSDQIIETSQSSYYQSHILTGGGGEIEGGPSSLVSLDLNDLRNTDVLTFGDGITLSDLTLTGVGDDLSDLRISINNTSDELTIIDQLSPNGNWGNIERSTEIAFGPTGILEVPDYNLGEDGQVTLSVWNTHFSSSFGTAPLFSAGIERFVFSDGTEYSREEFNNFIGSYENDQDNVIKTDDLGGVLDGGLGLDRLEGGEGNDTYVLGIGYEDDIASDKGGHDIVDFGENIAPELVGFTRQGENGDDLLIEIGGIERSSLYIEGQFSNDGSEIEEFHLSDGSVWTAEQIRLQLLQQSSNNFANEISGFEVSDFIHARDGDDIIEVRGGDDIVYGGEGRDTVIFDGPRSNFSITNSGDALIVEDLVGDQGYNRLYGVENLQFDESGNVEKIELVENIIPIASEISFIAREDTPFILLSEDILNNASDPDGESLKLISIKDTSGNDVEISESGQINFNFEAHQTGEVTYTYTVADSDGAEISSNFIITIENINDAPTAEDDNNLLTDEDVTLTFNASALLLNDTDIDSDNLAVISVQEQTSGNLILNSDGTITVIPESNFNGIISFTYTIEDTDGATSTATANVIVNPINDAPIAQDDTGIQGTEDESIVIPFDFLLINDEDIDGDTLTVSNIANPINGSIAFDEDGNIVFTPEENFNGTASFVYTISDGNGLEATALATLTFSAENDAPLLITSLNDQSSDEDTSWSFTIPANTFSDVDSDALTLTATLADGSELSAWLSFDSADQTFSGTPPQDFNGDIALRVTASDGELEVSEDFNLTINPVKDAPVAANDDSLETNEDTPLTITANSLLLNDSDVDGDVLTIISVEQLTNGTVAMNSNGDITFTPTANYNGPASFRYTVSDGNGGTATAVASLTIHAINDAPTNLISSTLEIEENSLAGAEVGMFSITDVDLEDSHIYSIVGGTGASQFTFDGNKLVVAEGSDLDYETTTSLTLDVLATDAAGLTTQNSFEISLLDDPTDNNGNETDDIIYGTYQNDILDGEGGNDTIFGLWGDDHLIGGTGADKLYGGFGSDTADYSGSSAGVNVSLVRSYWWWGSNQSASGGDAEGDQLFSIENLIGSNHDDQLKGNWKSNRLEGGEGNDLLTGGWGRDQFVFKSGDDVDTITDFDTGYSFWGWQFSGDKVILDVDGFDDFANVQDAMTSTGTYWSPETTIDFGNGDTLIFKGVHHWQLNADDFDFV